MRVCVVSSSLNPSPPWSHWTGYGSEIVAYWLARELGEEGHEVHLFATFQSEEALKGLKNVVFHGIPPTYGFVGNESEYYIVDWYLDVLKSCDVIHDMSASCKPAEYWFLHRRPFIVTRNGYSLHNPMGHKLNIVVLSEAVKKYVERLSEEMLGKELEVRVVPYGIPVDEYPFCNEEERQDYVLYVGRPHPSKGVDYIIALARENRDVKFVLAWNPTFYDHMDYHKEYVRAVKQLGLKNVAIIKLPSGWRGEQVKRQLMCKSRLFIQPTVYLEAFGLTAVEALATGTPILLSTAGSGPEIVTDTVGVLVPNKLSLREQAEEWVQKASRAINMSELNKALHTALNRKWDHEAIRAYAKMKYDIRVMAQNYMELYREVIEGRWWGFA
jgi:glycosyltransferase involved in cell wall biosynthesis